MKNKFNIGKSLILAAVLLVTSCSSNRVPFIITAQYADRPVLIGQYKRPGEKIDLSASGTSFESKQGTIDSKMPRGGDFDINKLTRDILRLNPKKTDMIIIREIKIKSSTWDIFTTSCYNESIVNGEVIGNSEK